MNITDKAHGPHFNSERKLVMLHFDMRIHSVEQLRDDDLQEFRLRVREQSCRQYTDDLIGIVR